MQKCRRIIAQPHRNADTARQRLPQRTPAEMQTHHSATPQQRRRNTAHPHRNADTDRQRRYQNATQETNTHTDTADIRAQHNKQTHTQTPPISERNPRNADTHRQDRYRASRCNIDRCRYRASRRIPEGGGEVSGRRHTCLHTRTHAIISIFLE